MPKEKIVQTSPLVNISLELLMHIFSYVLGSSSVTNENEKWPTKVKEVGTLAQTCRHFYQILEPQLNLQAKQLLLHVLRGDAINAEKMFTLNPELLFIEATASEHAAGIDETGKAVHRIVRASPYRAALGAGDEDLFNKMKVHFDKVGNLGATHHNPQGKTGWEMAKVQFYEQFPNGIVDYPESTYDTQFNALAAAITKDPVLKQAQNHVPALVKNPHEETKALLVQFRNDFLPKEAVTSGHHFNLNHLIKAFEVYIAHFNQWNWNQRVLFWLQIGYMERLVPAVDAQAFCMGLYSLLEKKQPPVRSFKLDVVSISESYFPVLLGPEGLGFDWGIYIEPLSMGHAGRVAGRMTSAPISLKKYVEQKLQALTALINTLNSQPVAENDDKKLRGSA